MFVTTSESTYKTAARFERIGLPVTLGVSPDRLWIERRETLLRSELPRLFWHDQNYVVHGRSLFAAPWLNDYVVLESGGDVAYVPLFSGWKAEALARIEDAGFTVYRTKDYFTLNRSPGSSIHTRRPRGRQRSGAKAAVA
jgi:hypothetical protein